MNMPTYPKQPAQRAALGILRGLGAKGASLSERMQQARAKKSEQALTGK